MANYYQEVDKNNNNKAIGAAVSKTNLELVFNSTSLTDEFLAGHGYMPIADNIPDLNPNQRYMVDGYSKKEDGTWSWDYTVVTYDQDYMINTHIRVPRITLLADSDFAVLEDSPLSAEDKALWVTYRQALRDMTSTYADFTDPDEIVWPTRPDVIAPSLTEDQQAAKDAADSN